jgi:23S rRNA maturation mini-RNase III
MSSSPLIFWPACSREEPSRRLNSSSIAYRETAITPLYARSYYLSEENFDDLRRAMIKMVVISFMSDMQLVLN